MAHVTANSACQFDKMIFEVSVQRHSSLDRAITIPKNQELLYT